MISLDEFGRRRAQLAKQMKPYSVAIIAAAPERMRNSNTEYAYRQDSSFWYLTGFPEPEALAVVVVEEGVERFILFCRDRDRALEVWNGVRAGQEGAMQHYGADEAYSINEIDQRLPVLLENKRHIYANLGAGAEFDQRLMGWVNQVRGKVRQGVSAPTEFTQLSYLLDEMRLIKSEAEIITMRESARIAAKAHVRGMQVVAAGMWEYQLEAEYLHEFMRHGARFPAYNTIVGGGANACILHYVENNQRLKAGDLVLVDAGCEWQHYASDITRTYPVNGRFSAPQQALYEVVLAAQLAAIEAMQLGQPYYSGHDEAVKVLTQGLCDLGLLKGELKELIETRAYADFYMHGTGHWLGIDVHDVGAYRQNGEGRALEQGMVFTVEPGLYVAADNLNVDEQWRGIGIRIEDNVVMTAKGPEIITHEVPKTVADITALMAGK